MSQTEYSIGELADVAEVTPRTIRYYTVEGLLPAPDTRGKYAVYTPEHLLRLRMIRRLKEAFLPLNEIRARLKTMTCEHMTHWLAASGGSESHSPSRVAQADAGGPMGALPLHSAADYLAALPGGAASSAQPPVPRPSAAPAPSAQLPILDSMPPPWTGRAQIRREDSDLFPLDFEGQRQRPARQLQLEPTETWQRLLLAPGVELHLREPVATELRERIQQLIARARELFA